MRTALALLPLALACTPDDPLSPPESDGEIFLSLDAEADFPERARLTGDAGTARLVPGGEPLPPGPYVLPDHELVVVDADREVRVSWSDRTVQLLPWIERRTLDDVIARGTHGVARFPEGDGHVAWSAGQPVELLDEAGGRLQVGTTLERALRVETWVDAMEVDQVFDADARDLPPRHETAFRFEGELLDGPRGEVLAWTLDDAVLFLEGDGEPVDGYRPVRFASGGVEVRGWAHEDDLEAQGVRVRYGACGGCFGHGSYGYGGPTNLPAGSWLQAWPEGPVVGQTLRPLWVESEDGWAPLSAATPWGEATVWAALP